MKISYIFLPLIFWCCRLNASITDIKVRVGGMVCTACVSVITKALTGKISELVSVKNIDLKTGIVTATLTDNNNLTIAQLQTKLNDAVQKSTYKFEAIQSIAAHGTVGKDATGLFFTVSNSEERIDLPASLKKQAASLAKNNSPAIISGVIEKGRAEGFSFTKNTSLMKAD